MRFGSSYKITKHPNGLIETNIKKVRDYTEIANETIHEERVQIIRISDFDDIMAKMHIDHALEDHGGWVEHGPNGRMYVVNRTRAKLATSYLTKENFSDQWEASQEFMEALRRPYDELERIKNNRPHPGIDPNYPKTTDGTTAAQVRIVPRRAIQQVPYGKAKVDGDEPLSILSEVVLTEEIIPNSNTQDNVLGKSWKGIEDSTTYGSTDAVVFYKVDGDYFGTDWRIPYKKEVYLEAGKSSYSECNLIFIKAYYQRSDIQSIIDKEKSLMASAKSRGEKYEPTWDLPLLESLIADDKDGGQKDEKDKTDSEKDRNVKTKGFEFVHGLQKGKEAEFLTYCKDVEGENKFIRAWTNQDPRGVIPVHRMYYECDMSNPEGRGIVELVAPLQNFLDSSLQSYQFIRSLMYAPPLLKRGSYAINQVQYLPNAIIDLGVEPNAGLETLNVNNAALGNFAQDYSLFKSIILNIFGSDDQTISSSAGNPSFSKTDAGVNARQAIVAVNDNFIRKRYEAWVSDIWETQLNLYFAITQGDRVIHPSKDSIEKLAKYPKNEYYELQEDGSVVIHFSNIQGKVIKFDVEASTSKSPDTNETKEQFLEAMKTVAEIGLGQNVDPQEATKRIFIQSGVEDPEKLLVMPQQQGMGGDPIEQLIATGLTPEQAQMAVELESRGYAPEQIDQIIQKQGAM